jgi:hypothetical protein
VAVPAVPAEVAVVALPALPELVAVVALPENVVAVIVLPKAETPDNTYVRASTGAGGAPKVPVAARRIAKSTLAPAPLRANRGNTRRTAEKCPLAALKAGDAPAFGGTEG